MAEDTSSGTGATPQPGSPATGTPASGSATPPVQPTPTVEELLKEIEALKHTHGNAKEELDRHRKKLSAYEKKEAEEEEKRKTAEEAQLSEIERTNKRYAELQASHNDYVQRTQERLIRYEVERQAGKLGIIDPDAAARLIDWAELEYDDDGTPNNAAKLLEKLVKSKPYLAPQQASQAEPAPNAPSQTPATSALRPANPALPPMSPGRTQIVAPGSRPAGRIPRLNDPGVFVPPGTPSKYQP